jgi:phosphate transport system substrate-binding protein
MHLTCIGVSLLIGLVGCSSPSASSERPGQEVLMNGAGATFPYPIYAKWFDEYHKLHADVKINYQSIGSGGGIRQLQAGTVDFGASDSPMTDDQLKQAPAKVLHFPTVLGAVVPTYNIAAVKQDLNFTSEALAGIFLGTIKKWNDPALVKANPGVSLPADDIVVVHRAEASGTTFVWTDYLSKVSSDWKSRVGAGTAVNWPGGLGAKGNEGVAGLVNQTPNAIGYVELVYAIQNHMSYGKIRNAAGNLVKADLASVTAAAASATVPADFRVSITNSPGKDAYPAASFTWLLVPEKIADPAKRRVMTDFLKWMLADGQKMAEPLGYAPLPQEVAAREATAIAQIQ